MSELLDKIKFNEDGLVPAIAQDDATGDVLMLAYMNREALELTEKTGKVHYWSRSRKKLWLKGETSGNVQLLKGLFYDCDADAILVRIEQIGGAACHTGHRSCFFNRVEGGTVSTTSKKVFDPEEVYGKEVNETLYSALEKEFSIEDTPEKTGQLDDFREQVREEFRQIVGELIEASQENETNRMAAVAAAVVADSWQLLVAHGIKYEELKIQLKAVADDLKKTP